MSLVESLPIILPVMLTVFTLSFGYKDNPLYQFCTYLLMGSAMGWQIVKNIGFLYNVAWMPMISGKPYYILAIILGILLLTRYYKKYKWVYRYPMAIIIGTGIGLSMRGALEVQILKQMRGMLLPLLIGDPISIISNLIVVIGSITSLYYFVFMVRFRTGPIENLAKYGRYFIMGALGATFGSTMTYRINLLIGRVEFLMQPQNISVSIVVVIIVLGYLIASDRIRSNG